MKSENKPQISRPEQKKGICHDISQDKNGIKDIVSVSTSSLEQETCISKIMDWNGVGDGGGGILKIYHFNSLNKIIK